MDDAKCKALKADLAAQTEPQIVSAERFFDGNDDLASIGCNLIDHPGVDAFRDACVALLHHPGVLAVYAQISELDPGDDCWPFTDTLLVVGTISAEELSSAVSSLQPDEVDVVEPCEIPLALAKKHDSPVLAVWWD